MTSQTTNNTLQQMFEDLHDLCQPLTALQCRLEVGRMLGHESALQEAVNGSLTETRRMFEVIAQMRQHLHREDQAAK
jgi:C4-dicarboxylate-specific signal transduction histidine kinase